MALEKEKIMIPRKITEGAYIRRNKQKCLNLNEGIVVSMVYVGGERGGWNIKGRSHCVYGQLFT